MSKDGIRAIVLRVISEIAPEADLARIEPTVNFRDQLDLDSMDFLNFVIGLHETLRVDIPESDYPRLASLASSVEYLASRVASNKESPR